MRKRFLTLGLTVTALLIGSAFTAASAENITFLAMHEGSTMAYISRDGVNLSDYTQMVASSDAVVSPIVIDGSTYLPFRYMTELVGFTDYTGTGNVKDKTFKYTNNGKGGNISFNKNGKIYDINVGEPFEFKVDDNDIREIEFRNIDGSLYAPMRYIANITDSVVDWDPVSSTIYFAKDDKTLKTFIEDDKSMKYMKTVAIMFKPYDNNLSYSDLYLKSENGEVRTVAKDLNDASTNYSVNRVRKTVYYINSDQHVCSKREGADKGNEIVFYNMKNKPQDVLVDNIITTKDKIYGIAIEKIGDIIGHVFEADLDGENFRYLNENRPAYNLLYRTYKGKEYIVYVDGNNYSTLCIMDLETNSEKSVNFVDSNYSNALESVDILTVGEDTVLYSDFNEKQLHCLNFNAGEIYEGSGGTIGTSVTEIDGYNNKSFKDIKSMNYEDENKVLFFAGAISEGEGIFYYDVENNQIGRLRNSPNGKMKMAIIKMSNSTYRIYHYDGKEYIFDLMGVSDTGEVTINNNIKLKRN